MERVAIVTGASKGIGKNIAQSLSRIGIKVVANYNKSEQEAIKMQKELEKEGLKIDIVKADVSKIEGVKKLVSHTLEKYKKIDILINNAGISKMQLITDVTDFDWNEMINTNLYSTFAMIREVARTMINQKNGNIINISSVWGQVGASMESIYSVTKAGIDALTKSLAKELGPSNIRVNSIAPGIIKTDMNNKLSEEEVEEIKEEIPLQRIGKPEEISKCVKWLIEDTYTTGQIISVNGGWFV